MTIIRANNIDLYYESSGSGTALLFIHGLGSSAADWEFQAPAFAKQYRVIAPDLRGHWRSSKPAGPYSMSQFAADLSALLKQLGTGPAHVVGHSLGGGIAFQLALDAPELVRSLTIVNSGPEMILRSFAQKFAIAQRFAIIKLFGLQAFGRTLASRLFPDHGQEPLKSTLVERFRHNQREPYLDSLRAFVGWSVTGRLDEIRCPTLVISGDQDYSPVAAKEAYVAMLPNARLAVVAHSRHVTPQDQPAEFNRILMEFLKVT
jgi:pimeloyl-ACP methyl ester carboxylesterase